MKSIHTWTPKKLRKRSERPQNQKNKKSARGGNGETKLTLSSKSPSAFHNVEIFIGLRIIILQSILVLVLLLMVVEWPCVWWPSTSSSPSFARSLFAVIVFDTFYSLAGFVSACSCVNKCLIPIECECECDSKHDCADPKLSWTVL